LRGEDGAAGFGEAPAVFEAYAEGIGFAVWLPEWTGVWEHGGVANVNLWSVVSAMGLSRREFVVGAAALGAVCGRSGWTQAPTGAAGPVVKTPLGAVQGLLLNGVRVFRGVPFAQPPVGDLRFRAPRKPAAWTGVRDATQFSASPMQPGEPGVVHNENCLYLYIWAPESGGPCPVFVWIHGGGFTGGHPFEPVYDGSEFARQGIVCVTVAYRLGVFGFLDVEPVLGASYAGSANNALRDLMMALEWVKENIGSFGGDAGKVTIGGESAGAKLTDILMGMPAAEGLFHQMISQSGGAERVWARPEAEKVGAGFGEAWQKSSGLDATTIATAAPEKLIAVQKQFLEDWPKHFPLRPEIDGELLPRLPVETISGGSARGKRLLIGTNRDESALFVGPRPAEDPTEKDLGNVSLAAFDEVFAKYAKLYPKMTPERRRIQALTAEEYWIPTIRVADAVVNAGCETWMYRLDFAETSGRLKGFAFHSLDVGLVWDKPHRAIENAGAEAALAKQMHDAWCSFIQGGAPAAAGLPEWPKCTSGERATMLLDGTNRVEMRPREEELRLWGGVL
jgi:para-nitrobenzyl esterase